MNIFILPICSLHIYKIPYGYISISNNLHLHHTIHTKDRCNLFYNNYHHFPLILHNSMGNRSNMKLHQYLMSVSSNLEAN